MAQASYSMDTKSMRVGTPEKESQVCQHIQHSKMKRVKVAVQAAEPAGNTAFLSVVQGDWHCCHQNAELPPAAFCHTE